MELIQLVNKDYESPLILTTTGSNLGQHYYHHQPQYNDNDTVGHHKYITISNGTTSTSNGQQGGHGEYFILDNNTLVPINSNGACVYFAPAETEDEEIPSHVLDHMYSKKPREPGSETCKPPKRRSKKKIQPPPSQIYTPEVIPDTTPKINIIRQRLPMTAPKLPSFMMRNNSELIKQRGLMRKQLTEKKIRAIKEKEDLLLEQSLKSQRDFESRMLFEAEVEVEDVPKAGENINIAIDKIDLKRKRDFLNDKISDNFIEIEMLESNESNSNSLNSDDDDDDITNELFPDFQIDDSDDVVGSLDFNDFQLNGSSNEFISSLFLNTDTDSHLSLSSPSLTNSEQNNSSDSFDFSVIHDSSSSNSLSYNQISSTNTADMKPTNKVFEDTRVKPRKENHKYKESLFGDQDDFLALLEEDIKEVDETQYDNLNSSKNTNDTNNILKPISAALPDVIKTTQTLRRSSREPKLSVRLLEDLGEITKPVGKRKR